MARLVSRNTLARVFSIPKFASLSPSPRPLARRNCSHQSGKPSLIEISIESEGGGAGGCDDLTVGIRKLEEAVDHFIVQRATPGWLPFAPGSSFWVPPRRRCNIVEFVGKLANRLTEEEFLSLTTLQGWPSSDYFIEEGSAPVIGVEVQVKVQGDSENTSQSEDQKE